MTDDRDALPLPLALELEAMGVIPRPAAPPTKPVQPPARPMTGRWFPDGDIPF